MEHEREIYPSSALGPAFRVIREGRSLPAPPRASGDAEEQYVVLQHDLGRTAPHIDTPFAHLKPNGVAR